MSCLRSAVLALVAAALACTPPAADGTGDESSTGVPDPQPRAIPVDLVWPELWVANPSSDIMPAHAPAEVDCDVGFDDELGLFEVDTALCNYGVFTQPLANEVFAGERVELVFTHDDLLAPEPAVGHIAVGIGGRVIWEIEIAIPGPYDLVRGEWIADAPIPVGTELVLHLHNHGYNNWRVISFKAGAP